MSTKDIAELLALKQKIEHLSQSDQLRLAADLLENDKTTLAETIADNVVSRLRLIRMLGTNPK